MGGSALAKARFFLRIAGYIISKKGKHMEKYITQEEYRAAKGVDLDLELHDLDDRSNKSKRFIKDVTDWCVAFLEANYRAFELEAWPDSGDPTDAALTEERQRLFREGVADQIEYVLYNGNVGQNAGINQDTGFITDLAKVELSRSAKRKFYLAGFCNI